MLDVEFITNQENNYSIDIAVLLVFFNRPNTLSKVFERIKEVRPSRLYLCQDGAREENPKDKENMEKCRAIANSIDWNCEVHRKYSSTNMGCDSNIYSALQWVFQTEDFMVMLEDDGLVDITFFPFCQQMYHRYKADTRVSVISSFNLTEQWDCPYDYFFSKSGTLSGGWAMWKRAWDECDKKFAICSNNYYKKILKNSEYLKPDVDCFLNNCNVNADRVKLGKAIFYFESIVGSVRFLNSSLAIVPTRNMMTNIGLDPNSYHGGSNIKQLPRPIQKIMFMKSYPMPKEIKHPAFMIADNFYYKSIFKILGNNKFTILLRKIESKIRRMIFK